MKSSPRGEKTCKGKSKGAKHKTESMIQGRRRSARLKSILNNLPLQSPATLNPCCKLEDNPHPDQDKHHWNYHFHSAKRLKEVGEVTKPMQETPSNEHVSEGHSISNLPSQFQAMIDDFSAPFLQVSSLVAPPTCSKYFAPKHYEFSLSAKRLKDALASKPMAVTPPIENEESEGHSRSNDFLEPFPSRPVASIPNINERQHVKIPSTSSPPAATVDLLTDKTNPTIPMTENVPNRRIEHGLVTTENEGSRNCKRHDPLSTAFEDTREVGSYGAVSSFVGTPTVMVSNVFEQRLEDSENPIEHGDQTVHFGLTEIVDTWADEDLGADEAESAAVLTILGKYVVKQALAPTAMSIIEKHGDIVASCHMETLEGRSLFLEHLAEFIQKFETKRFAELSESEIEAAIKLVCDFSKVGLNVGWLEQRLKDLLEARRMIKQYSTLKERQKKQHEVIKEKTRALKMAESRLLLAQQQVNAAKKELDVELAETESLKTTMSNVVDNVKYFNAHPPLHGLF